MTIEGKFNVEVVYALPDRYWSLRLRLDAGATVAEALAIARTQLAGPDFDIDEGRLAVFSRPVGLATPLRDGDRLELLRPLAADPKQGRRDRARNSTVSGRQP